MAPPRFADYCVELFAGSKVSVEVISDINTIDKDYPNDEHSSARILCC